MTWDRKEHFLTIKCSSNYYSEEDLKVTSSLFSLLQATHQDIPRYRTENMSGSVINYLVVIGNGVTNQQQKSGLFLYKTYIFWLLYICPTLNINTPVGVIIVFLYSEPLF